MQRTFGGKMNRNIFIAAVCGTLLNIQFAVAQNAGQPAQAEQAMQPMGYPIHASDLLRKKQQTLLKFLAAHPEAVKPNGLRKASWSFTVGSHKSWYADSLASSNPNPNASRYLVPSTCKAVGANCYIFVEDSSWNNRLVDSAAVDSIRVYFDSKTPANPAQGIFQTDTIAFGAPPDVDGDPKIIIFLLNINDGYTPGSGFVEGYFNSFNEIDPVHHPQYNTSNYAEMFFIDTYPLNLKNHSGLYEAISTLAHEFQHMIQFNMTVGRGNQEHLTFINEGCSLVAEVNCGFPIYSPSFYANETNHYLLDWRDDMNAVLRDYSRAARFFVYLRDQAGMRVFKPLVASQYSDLRCIDDALSKIGNPLRFHGLLQDWFIANILDDRSVDTLYGYLYSGLPKPAEMTYTNPNVSLHSDSVQNYAVQYVAFTDGSQLHTTFTASSDSLIIKAVEIGSPSRVLDVTKGAEFFEPLFGTTYTAVHFVVMNVADDSVHRYSSQASGVSDVEQADQALPKTYGLSQNYPNPFNPKTVISYQLPVASIVNLRVYDLLGHEIATLVNGVAEAGYHTVTFNAAELASGIYFYRIVAGNFAQTRKLIILK
jgi:hypothetical protein